MPNTLYFTNTDYFDRMESKTSLDCFKQCHRLLKKYSSIGNCLDVGCAPGYLYFHLSDLFGHYHGVDSSARSIEYGREQFSKEQVANAHQVMQLTDKVDSHPRAFRRRDPLPLCPRESRLPFWIYYHIYSLEIDEFADLHGWQATWHELTTCGA